MKKHIFNRGQEVLYIKGDILLNQLALEAYYLEECDDKSERYYLTTNKEKIQTFDQKKDRIMFGDDVFIVNEYDKILKYNDKLYNRYITINSYLNDNFDTYHNATRYFLFRDIFPELYNASGDNEKLYKNTKEKQYHTHSKLCKSIIKIPYFYSFRFRLHILLKYIFGTFRQILYLPLFLKDLVANLYADYFNYCAAKHELGRLKREKDYSPKNEVQERYDNKAIETKKHEIESKKEIYVKSNIAFFTFVLAIIVFIFTVIFNTYTLHKKDDEITTLKIQNEKLEQKIEELRNNTETETLLNQNQINNNLALTINQLTEIVNELKNGLIKISETVQKKTTD
jgi:hypothetical protein